MKKIKHGIPLLILILVWGMLAVYSWMKPADAFSTSERRKLAALPKLTMTSVMSGKYASDFESYTLDQFPFRDTFHA